MDSEEKTVVDTENVEVEDTSTEETPSDKPTEEERKGVFNSLFNKIMGKKSDDVEDVDEEETQEEYQEEEEGQLQEEVVDNLPDPDLIRVGQAVGWSDEKIQKYLKEDPEVLQGMKHLIDIKTEVPKESEDSPEQEERLVGLTEEELEALKNKLSEDGDDSVFENAVKPIAEKLNKAMEYIDSMRGEVKQSKEEKQQQAIMEEYNVVNNLFDKAAETFPELGKTDDLIVNGKINETHPSFHKRADVFNTYYAFRNMGLGVQEAMNQAMQWYKGGNVEQKVESKIKGDLNKRKKKFTNRPTSKKTVETYASKREKGVAQVSKTMKNLGIT